MKSSLFLIVVSLLSFYPVSSHANTSSAPTQGIFDLETFSALIEEGMSPPPLAVQAGMGGVFDLATIKAKGEGGDICTAGNGRQGICRVGICCGRVLRLVEIVEKCSNVG